MILYLKAMGLKSKRKEPTTYRQLKLTAKEPVITK